MLKDKNAINKKTNIFLATVFIIFSSIIFISVILGVNKKDIKKASKIEIGDEIDDEMNDELKIPKMYFEGNIEGMQDKSDKRKIKVIYRSREKCYESYALLKIQGSNTLNFDKKNYNITFYTDKEFNKKQKFDVKWGEFSKYTLKANWTDQLFGRNIVTAQIASQINKKYGVFSGTVNNGLTDGFPIEIYINNEFLGLYTLNIHKDYLFNLDKENEKNIAIFTNNPQQGVFEYLETEEWNRYEIEYGEKNKKTLDRINRLLNFLINSSDDEYVKKFEDYFNLDSVLNYYCMMQYAQLTDNVIRNVFLITYDGKIWYTGLYDLDLSWGNNYNGNIILQNYDNYKINMLTTDSFLWRRFEKFFYDKITERYKELRKDILTKENVINKMNEFNNLIPKDTLEKEYKRWNNKPNYDLSYLEEYLDNRISVIDEQLGINK